MLTNSPVWKQATLKPTPKTTHTTHQAHDRRGVFAQELANTRWAHAMFCDPAREGGPRGDVRAYGGRVCPRARGRRRRQDVLHSARRGTRHNQSEQGRQDTITSFYGSSCANNGEDALNNTPETLPLFSTRVQFPAGAPAPLPFGPASIARKSVRLAVLHRLCTSCSSSLVLQGRQDIPGAGTNRRRDGRIYPGREPIGGETGGCTQGEQRLF
eukprot:5902262-Pyramimonas_sp.AAC.1